MRTTEGWLGASGVASLAVLQVFTFILKMLAVVWVLMAVRWAFPRFRYDQIMRLGWKMMLPVSLSNVVITAAVFLWAGRRASPGWASSSGRDRLLHRHDRL